MADHNKPYDPPQIQQKVDLTIAQLQKNLRKADERGGRLDDLQSKTDDLAVSAGKFHRGANTLRKQMWWKDMKMRMCLIVGIIILLLVIIIPTVVVTKHHHN